MPLMAPHQNGRLCQAFTGRGAGSPVPAQRRAQAPELSKDRAAPAADLEMPLEIRGGSRVELTVKIRLHARRFRTDHARLRRALPASVSSGPPAHAPGVTSPCR